MKSQGFFKQSVINYVQLVINSLTSQVAPLAHMNYLDALLAVEKYYIRQRFFGSALSTITLAQFINNLDQEEVLNIGGTTETNIMVNIVAIEENISINQQTVYPLFSPVVHYAHEHKTIFSTYSHPFHLVDPSPWPFCTAIGLWYLTFTTVAYFHNFLSSAFNIVFGLIYLWMALGFWWRDVIRESTYEFKHTPYVRRGLLTGMLLFIISEIMFFFGFFWAFFSC